LINIILEKQEFEIEENKSNNASEALQNKNEPQKIIKKSYNIKTKEEM